MARLRGRWLYPDHAGHTRRFSVRATLYGKADRKTADRAINCVVREKRRHFHLNDRSRSGRARAQPA